MSVNREQLQIAFVSVIRPLFKGDSPQAARRSLGGLSELGRRHGFDVITAHVAEDEEHLASGQPLPDFAVSTREGADRAARQIKALAPDLLLIQHTTFSTGDLLVPLLNAARRVGLWALPENEGDARRSGPLPLNALCGLNMTLSFLDHAEVGKHEPVKWFYGSVRSAPFHRRLLPTLQALRGLRAADGARILQIGGTAPAFYGIEERPVLEGVTVETRSLGELFQAVEQVARSDAQALAQAWADREPSNVSADQLERAARIELGLGAMAEEANSHAIALRCWPELPDACGAMACAAVGALGDRDIPAACEGDVMGALSMLILAGMSGQQAVLMDLSDVDFDDDSLLFWHCGNAPLTWASEAGSRLTTHFNRDALGVVRDMTLREGGATGFRLLSSGRRGAIFGGDFLGPGKTGFDGVRGWLTRPTWNGLPVGAEGFVANVLDNRLPHHFALAMGDLQAGLRELCAWLGADVLPASDARHTL